MTHVVALSGGKDSTALALRLAEVEPRAYVYVCTPTGNEPAEMFAHWRHLGEMLGTPITPIVAGSLVGLIREQHALPNVWMRWCTRKLKIEPYAQWLAAHAPAVSYVGIRADEPEREGGDYTDVDGVTMRFPLREWGWTKRHVYDYLDTRGITVPTRTDCNLCFFQRLGEWYALWLDHPEAWPKESGWKPRQGTGSWPAGRDRWPAALTALRAEFERGNAPKGP